MDNNCQIRFKDGYTIAITIDDATPMLKFCAEHVGKGAVYRHDKYFMLNVDEVQSIIDFNEEAKYTTQRQ